MAAMDYFRRPVLAGQVVTHQAFATVRGDLRRLDVDGSSAVPYFAGITAGDTLILSLDGAGPTTVTFGGSPPGGINNVITDINTAIGINGNAFDAFGTIGISTSTSGSGGSVEITGGTVAAALGFDITLNEFKSYGGEIASTPEGGVSNPFQTSFLLRGENFTQESVVRGMARLASNSDVLFSDLSRNDVVVRKVNFTTSDGIRLQLSTATDEIFSGLGLLTNASTKEDLIPYFQLIDTATKQPAKSRVVAVVRGAPGGSPPFSNASAWSGGGSAGNILGVTLPKVTGAAIDTIYGGRVVKCGAANFADVQPGDFATITGSTNVTPWSNEGNRWVVEEVISQSSPGTVSLRPMSKTELALVGFSTADVQPIVELNTEVDGIQTFGNLTISTGAYCSGIGVGVSVVVSPSIPPNATYELWAAGPQSSRSRAISDAQATMSVPIRRLVSDLDPVADWTLTGMAASLSGGNCVITAGTIVWHGQVYNIPGQTLLNSAFTDGTSYVYWDEATGNTSIATATTAFSGIIDPTSSSKGHMIAVVTRVTGALTVVTPTIRLKAEKAVSITVGIGGQFPDLFGAILWAKTIQNAYSDGGTSAASYPHFEFVLVSDVTTNNQSPELPSPGATVRGIHPRVKLNLGTGSFICKPGNTYEFRDFCFAGTGTQFITTSSGGVLANLQKIWIHNVRHEATAGSSLLDVVTGASALQQLRITDSSFMLSRSVCNAVGLTAGVNEIFVLNSVFTYDSTGSIAPHLFAAGTVFSNPWNGDTLVIENCDFLGQWGGTFSGADANTVFVAVDGSAHQVNMRNVRISLGAYGSAQNNVLFSATTGAGLYMDNVTMTAGKITKAIVGSTGTYIHNSTFFTCPRTSTASCTGHTFDGCTLVNPDTDNSSHGSGFGIEATGFVVGCNVSGPYNAGIHLNGVEIQAIGNRIAPGQITNAIPVYGILVESAATRSLVSDNVIVWDNSAQGLATGVNGINDGADRTTLSNNKIYFPEPSGGSVQMIGISVGGISCNVTGNSVATTTTGAAAGGQLITGMLVASSDVSVVGNVLRLNGSTTQNWRGIFWTPSTGILSGNFIESYGRCLTTSSAPDNCVITGNQFFSSTSSSISGGYVQNIGGNVSGNRFTTSGSNSVSIGYGFYSNNDFFSDVLLHNGFGGGITEFIFTGNYVSGVLDGVTNTITPSKLDINGNRIDGAVTISATSTIDGMFNNNTIGGAVSLTWNGGSLIANGNEEDSFTVAMGTTVRSTVISTGHRVYTGNITITGSDVEICDCDLPTGQIVVFEGFTTGGLTKTMIVGNAVGFITTFSQSIHVSQNTVGAGFDHSRTVGVGQVVVDGNIFGIGGSLGSISITGFVGGVSYAIDEVTVYGNYCTGTNASITAQAASCSVCNNSLIPTDGPTVSLVGDYIRMDQNVIYGSALTASQNAATTVTVDSLTSNFTAPKLWMNENFIYGRVNLSGSANSYTEIWFCQNYIYNLSGSTSAVLLHSVSESAYFLNNSISQDFNGVANLIKHAIEASGTTQNVHIEGNTLNLISLSPTYSSSFSFGVISLEGTGNTFLILSGNIILKPINATIGGHSIVCDYIQVTDAASVVVNTNIMAAGGTVGAAPERQGGLHYEATNALYRIAE